MAIRASSSREVDALVADLSSGRAVERDAAIARLTVIGARAVARLVTLAESNAAAPARLAALRALDAIGDPRSLDAALRALDDGDPGIAAAAIGITRQFLDGDRGAETVDRLTKTALDGARPDPVRLAALRVLKTLDGKTIAPLLASLAADASAALRAEAEPAAARRAKPKRDPVAELTAIAEAGLPDDAAALQRIVGGAGPDAPLPVLLKVIERVRDRAAAEPAAARSGWTTVRALAHLALARRGSRLALFDLREWLERSAEPLPVDALAALSQAGDASCLEPIAAAHARAAAGWWRDHLAEVFRTIAAREGVTRRHAVLKRIAKRWPAVLSTP